MDSKIFHYTQPAHMTRLLYANDLHAKSCKFADVYDISTGSKIFIEEFNPFSYLNIWEYWSTQTQAQVSSIANKAQSLFAILKNATKAVNTNNQCT